MPFVIFRRDIGDHLRFGIICGPIWGSFPVWGSFAVGDHLRRCTDHYIDPTYTSGIIVPVACLNVLQSFEESLVKFKQHLRTRGYPKTVIDRSLSGVNFAAIPSALTQKKKANERILHFVTTYYLILYPDLTLSLEM